MGGDSWTPVQAALTVVSKRINSAPASACSSARSFRVDGGRFGTRNHSAYRLGGRAFSSQTKEHRHDIGLHLRWLRNIAIGMAPRPAATAMSRLLLRPSWALNAPATAVALHLCPSCALSITPPDAPVRRFDVILIVIATGTGRLRRSTAALFAVCRKISCTAVRRWRSGHANLITPAGDTAVTARGGDAAVVALSFCPSARQITRRRRERISASESIGVSATWAHCWFSFRASRAVQFKRLIPGWRYKTRSHGHCWCFWRNLLLKLLRTRIMPVVVDRFFISLRPQVI